MSESVRGPKLSLSNSEKARLTLSKGQQKNISDIYSSLAKELSDKAEKLGDSPNKSSYLKRQELNKLAKELKVSLSKSNSKIEGIIKDTMSKTAQSVVDDNLDFLDKVGFNIEGAFSHVPDDIVERLASGQVYEGNWTLSKAIWKQGQKIQEDINTIIAKGIAANKGSYNIAKDLEKYVDPKAAKEWDWSKVYPGTNKKIDYNAQRLARTLTSHAYQQSLMETTKDNPFVTKLQWRSAEIQSRTCDLCKQRNGQLFDKDKLPMDHPNGLCTFLTIIPDNLNDISDRIAKWANGESDPDLDKFSSSLTGKEFKKTTSKVPAFSEFKKGKTLSWAEANKINKAHEKETKEYFKEYFHKNLTDKFKTSADGQFIVDDNGNVIMKVDKFVDNYMRYNFMNKHVASANGYRTNRLLRQFNGNIDEVKNYLRTQGDYEALQSLDFIEKFDDIIKRLPGLSDDIQFSRQVGGNYFDELLKQLGLGDKTNFATELSTNKPTVEIAERLQKLIGTEYKEYSFSSISPSNSGKKGADGNYFIDLPVQLSIKCPKGSKVYFVEGIAKNHEAEVLLPPNSKLVIKDIKYVDSANITYMEKLKGKELIDYIKKGFIEVVLELI